MTELNQPPTNDDVSALKDNVPETKDSKQGSNAQKESSSSTRKTTKKKKQSAQREHIRRKARFLRAEIDCLTPFDVELLVEHCTAEIQKDECVLLLASLLTGQRVQKLLSSKLRLKNHAPNDASDFVSILSSAAWPANKRQNDVVQYQVKDLNACHIILPNEISSRLQQIHLGLQERSDRVKHEKYLEKAAKNKLVEISQPLSRAITLGRVRSYLAYHRHQADINRTEHALISDELSQGYSQPAYIRFDNASLFYKHAEFIKNTLGKFAVEYTLPAQPALSSFGSNMVPEDHEITDFFESLYQSLVTLSISDQYEFKRIHNLKTVLFANLLQLLTLHRPVHGMFRTRRHFDVNFSWMLVQDKGDESKRKIPLPPTASMLMKAYLWHLEDLKVATRFSQPEVHDTLDQILAGEANLFQVWNAKNEMSDLHPKIDYKKHFEFAYPENWHRHKAATVMYQQGLDMELVATFMGHEPERDKNMFKYGTTSYSDLRSISHKLEQLAQHLFPKALLKNIEEQ